MQIFSRRAFCLSAAGATGAILVGTASAQSETTLQKIRRTGQMTVATEAAYAPYEFVKDGKIVGLGADLLAIVAQEMGAPVQQLDLPFQGILPGLLAGKFDFVATSIGLTSERAQRYAYTMPIGDASSYIFKKAGNTAISKLEDLNGKIVIIQLGATDEQVVAELDAKLKSAGGQGFADIKKVPGFPDQVLALANGTADLGVAGLVLIANLIAERPNFVEIVDPATDRVTYICWVTRPEDTDLRDELNRIFEKVIADGRMSELQKKWLGTTVSLPTEGYLPEGAI